VIDDLHLAIAPVVLGRGEALFTDIDLPSLGYHVTENVASEFAMHVVLSK
jgi:dihydrofolate reductase